MILHQRHEVQAVTTTVVLRSVATPVHLLGLVIEARYDFLEAHLACDNGYGNVNSYGSVCDDFSIEAVAAVDVEVQLPT